MKHGPAAVHAASLAHCHGSLGCLNKTAPVPFSAWRVKNGLCTNKNDKGGSGVTIQDSLGADSQTPCPHLYRCRANIFLHANTDADFLKVCFLCIRVDMYPVFGKRSHVHVPETTTATDFWFVYVCLALPGVSLQFVPVISTYAPNAPLWCLTNRWFYCHRLASRAFWAFGNVFVFLCV